MEGEKQKHKDFIKKSFVADFTGHHSQQFFAYCRSVVVCATTVSKLLRQILLRQQDQSKVLREITLQENNTEHFTIRTLTQQAQKRRFQKVWLKKKS